LAERQCDDCGSLTQSGRHRLCFECGLAHFIAREHARGRWAGLDTLRHDYLRRKAATTNTRYGLAHQRLRQQWEREVEAGGVRCARCHLPIQPGERWELDHRDDRNGYLGPSHRLCNGQAAAAKANGLSTRPAATRLRWSRQW
jgi:hypothetical protein